ncbi:Lrp/AsnC family transcriptional regulator [Kaistia adipata]|uniref:Lrp/AsnC family transcriptional regulator n=1 Tax=Kaistia adipata TaxID=166954 RepID=UPI0004017FE4|nr:Lrp/AsnC family transcriptional regulator [Kaistia adipata]
MGIPGAGPKSPGDAAKEAAPLDATDRKLVALLQENARASVAELARKLKLGRTTVHDRIARLERNGVILGYTPILARTLRSQASRAIVMLSLVQRMQPAVMDRLRMLPEVLTCHTVSGDFDLALMVEAPQMDDLDAVLDEIINMPGVERCRSSIIMTTNFHKG